MHNLALTLTDQQYYATGRGMGLALWKTEDSYKDMQSIVAEVEEEVYTALTNPDENQCTDQDCDGNLVNIIK